MIDPKLVTLLTVNELNSFTKAAQKLSLTQPAASQHVRQLEKELGVTIFVRGEGNLKLTSEGEIVIKYAKRIVSLYQNLQQSLKDERRHARKITVGITHTSESNIMVEVLAKYSSFSEGTRITIISDVINNLYMKLKTYEIDLAIVEGRITDPNFNSVMLDTDSLILAVSNKNPLSKKSMVTLNELKKENLILRLPDSGTRNLFISHLESNNVSLDEFNVILEVDNVATIKDLVRRDFGVSILARSACANELKKGKMAGLPIENLSMTREINMVYHKDFEHTDLLQNIMRIYNEYSVAGAVEGKVRPKEVHFVDTPDQLL
ncbi:MAG: LysR substrate-binding domain-containing protein [Eisenbergiella massiliensis]